MMTFVSSFRSWSFRYGGLLVLALGLAGCETPSTGTAPPQPGVNVPPPPELSPDLLVKGHKVTITFSETSNPPGQHEETIREDGTITPPLVGSVVAAGKKVGELQEELQNLYVPKYYKRLSVTVRPEARFFTVSGEVRGPSLQPYMGQMTVLRGIAAAGGFTDWAKKKKVQVTRPGKDKPIIVNCNKAIDNPKLDIPIYPGDQIHVPKRYL